MMGSTTSSADRMKFWRKYCWILCRDGRAPTGNFAAAARSTFPCSPSRQRRASPEIKWSRGRTLSWARQPANRWPLGRRPTRCPAISIRILEEHRNSLPTANAGRGDSIAQFRVTEFTRERKSEPDAGGRQRMPNRNRAAIHIEFVAVDPQLALHSDELRGKRFVDLESIDLT